MLLDSIPLFSMLKSRLGYENQREKLIGQNVANADTPGFSPQDLKTFTLPKEMGGGSGDLQLAAPAAAARSGFIQTGPSGPGQGQWKVTTATDSETTLDGNSVVLEDQMAKLAEARMDYEAALGFYQKSLDMLRLAARRPGASS
jgi:flagellar basal-body rod protein FlgB